MPPLRCCKCAARWPTSCAAAFLWDACVEPQQQKNRLDIQAVWTKDGLFYVCLDLWEVSHCSSHRNLSPTFQGPPPVECKGNHFLSPNECQLHCITSTIKTTSHLLWRNEQKLLHDLNSYLNKCHFKVSPHWRHVLLIVLVWADPAVNISATNL